MKDGLTFFMWCVCLPRCVVINMYREYRAVMMMFTPIRMIVVLDHENEVITTNSSPIRLIVGGRAKFVRLASSHQAAIRGRMV